MIGLKVFATALIVFVICVAVTPSGDRYGNTWMIVACVGLFSLAVMIAGLLMAIWL